MAKTKPSWPDVTGLLAEYADGLRAKLARLGYTPLTAAGQLRLMAHLSRWMTARFGCNGVVFTGASSVAVTLYRYRGSTIPTPWAPARAPR